MWTRRSLGLAGRRNRRVAQKRYREFVRDGITNRPWDELKAPIYLGSDKFIERRSAEDKEIKEIPRAQLHAFKPTLERIFARSLMRRNAR